MFKSFGLLSIVTLLFIACGGGGASSDLQKPPANADPQLVRLINQANNLKTPNAFRDLARYYAKKKQTTNAIRNYEKASTLDSTRMDIFFELGEYSFNQNVKRTALRSFKYILQGVQANNYANRIAAYIFGYKITQITFDTSNSAYPAFSGDSREIYFQTDRKGNWDIARVPVTGGTPTMVLESEANEEHPTISYDNRYMIYTTDEYDQRLVHESQRWREIVSYDIGSAQKSRLTLNYLDDFYPRVKNKNELTFVREIPDDGVNKYGSRKTNVYVMNIDGTFQVPLTKGSYHDNSGVVINNGSATIFSSDRDGKNWNLFNKNNSNQSVAQLTQYDFNAISVDADSAGSRIVFSSDQNGSLDIYMTNQTANRLERLSFHSGDADQPVFSPDGNYIAFHSNNGGTYNIFVANLLERSEEPTVFNLLNKIDQDLLTL